MTDLDEVPPPSPPSPTRPVPAWVGKAVFEAGLIVLGLVGALVVDEWRDARERSARVRTALTSILAELQTNRALLVEVIAGNEALMEALRESARTGTTYQKGLVRSAPLSAVAWEAARDAAITNDIDHPSLMTLGRAYRALDGYRTEVGVFSNYLYTYAGPGSLRESPLRLEGWISDLTGRARSVLTRLDEAIGALGQAGVTAPRSP
jgi:hypothetical protein